MSKYKSGEEEEEEGRKEKSMNRKNNRVAGCLVAARLVMYGKLFVQRAMRSITAQICVTLFLPHASDEALQA